MDEGQNNAFANNDEMHNCYVMEYGIGDGVEMRPVVALDILAHEYTHLVTASTANLEYMGESGALNESFSDMLGISIKKAVKGSKANWLIGDEVMLQVPCMRDMSNKIVGSEGVQPIYYKGDNWYDGTEDHGGVHTNSGVPNYWFYLVAQSNDMEVASNIAYRTLTQYLTPTSNFYDARKATLQVADDIYGYDEEWDFGFEYKSVESAWNEVGVFDKTDPTGIIAVTRMVNNNETDNWYNLQGQRIDKPSKTGVYIHNEKKVIIK
jgi:Zn-dependent metalloprotease